MTANGRPQHTISIVMYYVYLIQSKKNGQFYLGYTSDLRRRINEHNTGQSIATKAYAPYKLVYY